MLLIAVRSLNYRMSIVYCEPISPSFYSVHLSVLPHSPFLIFIFSRLPREYTTSREKKGNAVGKLLSNTSAELMKEALIELYFITDPRLTQSEAFLLFSYYYGRNINSISTENKSSYATFSCT